MKMSKQQDKSFKMYKQWEKEKAIQIEASVYERQAGQNRGI